MQAFTFWKHVTMDEAGFLEQFIDLLEREGIDYCVIGGQGVNAYVEPLVSLDLDLVAAVAQMERAKAALQRAFQVKAFPHRLNVSAAGSDLRVQIQTDPRYSDFVERAALRDVLGLTLPVATLEDVLQGKIWAAQDPTRRGSKRQKDLADIARMVEAYPELKGRVPAEILARLEMD